MVKRTWHFFTRAQILNWSSRCENGMQRFEFACFHFCNAFTYWPIEFLVCVLSFFAARLCIWLCVFAARLQNAAHVFMKMFAQCACVLSICMCFLNLQHAAFAHVGHRSIQITQRKWSKPLGGALSRTTWFSTQREQMRGLFWKREQKSSKEAT